MTASDVMNTNGAKAAMSRDKTWGGYTSTPRLTEMAQMME